MGDKWLQHRSSKLRVPSITYDSVHCLTSWTSQILALKTYPKLYRRANRDQNVRNFAGKTRGRTASAAVEKHRVKVSENMGVEFKRGGGKSIKTVNLIAEEEEDSKFVPVRRDLSRTIFKSKTNGCRAPTQTFSPRRLSQSRLQDLPLILLFQCSPHRLSSLSSRLTCKLLWHSEADPPRPSGHLTTGSLWSLPIIQGSVSGMLFSRRRTNSPCCV